MEDAKNVTCRFPMYLRCSKFKGYLWNVEDQIGKIYDDVETVTEISYLVDRMNVGRRCETFVTARTGLGWLSRM